MSFPYGVNPGTSHWTSTTAVRGSKRVMLRLYLTGDLVDVHDHVGAMYSEGMN